MAATIDELPTELLDAIFSFFVGWELLPLERVCARWKHVVRDLVWKRRTVIRRRDVVPRYTPRADRARLQATNFALIADRTHSVKEFHFPLVPLVGPDAARVNSAVRRLLRKRTDDASLPLLQVFDAAQLGGEDEGRRRLKREFQLDGCRSVTIDVLRVSPSQPGRFVSVFDTPVSSALLRHLGTTLPNIRHIDLHRFCLHHAPCLDVDGGGGGDDLADLLSLFQVFPHLDAISLHSIVVQQLIVEVELSNMRVTHGGLLTLQRGRHAPSGSLAFLSRLLGTSTTAADIQSVSFDARFEDIRRSDRVAADPSDPTESLRRLSRALSSARTKERSCPGVPQHSSWQEDDPSESLLASLAAKLDSITLDLSHGTRQHPFDPKLVFLRNVRTLHVHWDATGKWDLWGKLVCRNDLRGLEDIELHFGRGDDDDDDDDPSPQLGSQLPERIARLYPTLPRLRRLAVRGVTDVGYVALVVSKATQLKHLTLDIPCHHVSSPRDSLLLDQMALFLEAVARQSTLVTFELSNTFESSYGTAEERTSTLTTFDDCRTDSPNCATS